MKKILESIRKNRELIITNMIVLALTFTEAIIALTGHTTIAGIVAIAVFICAVVFFIAAPYGEQVIAACTTMCNAAAFGIGMFYNAERTYIAYVTIAFVVIGFVLEYILTDNRKIGRL